MKFLTDYNKACIEDTITQRWTLSFPLMGCVMAIYPRDIRLSYDGLLLRRIIYNKTTYELECFFEDYSLKAWNSKERANRDLKNLLIDFREGLVKHGDTMTFRFDFDQLARLYSEDDLISKKLAGPYGRIIFEHKVDEEGKAAGWNLYPVGSEILVRHISGIRETGYHNMIITCYFEEHDRQLITANIDHQMLKLVALVSGMGCPR